MKQKTITILKDSGGKLFFYLFYFILTLFVVNNSFFWDTIQLSSRHAHFYFDNNLQLDFLPLNMDSGHIPFFGYMLAVCWKIFGYSLITGHLMMLPFLFGVVYQSHKLIEYLLPSKGKYLPMILLLADSSLLAQATLVTPDIFLIFSFLLLLNSILKDNKILRVCAVFLLALVSMRGWMTALVLFIFEGVISYESGNRSIKVWAQKIAPYLPGGLLALTFIILHYISRGWIGYHEDSPWAVSFQKVGFKGGVYNIGIYIWRLIDFGRFVWWIMLVLAIRLWWPRLKTDTKLKKLALLALLFLILYPISMLMHAHLLQHRYLLPVILSVALLSIYILMEFVKPWVSYLVLVILLLGNVIVYPDQVAQGWDATLAHLPYYKLHERAIDYMESEGIERTQTKSWFPNLSSERDVALKNSADKFSNEALNKCEYALYSNVFNDVEDADYDQMNEHWELIYSEKVLGLKMFLYKNPKGERHSSTQ